MVHYKSKFTPALRDETKCRRLFSVFGIAYVCYVMINLPAIQRGPARGPRYRRRKEYSDGKLKIDMKVYWKCSVLCCQKENLAQAYTGTPVLIILQYRSVSGNMCLHIRYRPRACSINGQLHQLTDVFSTGERQTWAYFELTIGLIKLTHWPQESETRN